MFFELFGYDASSLVNFVGAGGKTALVLKLLEEAPPPQTAVYTTTTRIHPPHPSDGMAVLSSANEAYLKLLAETTARLPAERAWRLVLTRSLISPGKLGGVSAGFAHSLDRKLFSIILNEADGARGMSIKVPRAGEPVLMEGADCLVPVIGIDCLGRLLGPDVMFRWEVAAEQFQLQPGLPLTPELAAAVLMHPQGVCRDWKPGMRIVPYINKVDEPDLDSLAETLGRALLRNGHFPVERVVWGSVQTGRAGLVM